ncbi:MAG: molybdopterin molybdenumtransferase MoeA, partial [Thermoleophilaceae bacterium]|nr:molybdopterin molybdenumtransferase MoeA [Thermoleophilaceae bacterium]
MLDVAEARRLVLAAVPGPLPSEAVPLMEAAGRVLAQDVAAAEDLPPFAASAMDGYAVRSGPEAELEVVGESRAGAPAGTGVGPGQAIGISTGAA